MQRFRLHRKTLVSLLTVLLWLQTGPSPAQKNVNINTQPGPVELSPAPPIQPETLPKGQNPGEGSPYSVDTPANSMDFMQYEAYNVFPRELDLWNLEGKRYLRSDPVLSPDKSVFAYSEIMFMPNTKQTIARLYLVQVPPPPPMPTPRLPSEEALGHTTVPVNPQEHIARFDPNRTTRLRQSIATVGYDKVKPFEFKTLTIVDWSASGRRLLFKQRSGVLHVGLQVSDILIYDQAGGTVTIYPEVHRIISHYWQNSGNLPHFDQLAWDIQPLGWAPGSDATVLLKAWAYDKNEKKFLGLWEYDVDAQRTRMLSLQDIPQPVAANGWLASPALPPPQPSKISGLKARFRKKPSSITMTTTPPTSAQSTGGP